MNRLNGLLLSCLFLSLLSLSSAGAIRGEELGFEDLAETDALAGLSKPLVDDGLSNAERSDLEAHGLGDAELGAYQAAYRSGFDIHRDTPDFDKFRGLLSKGGTCTGVSTLVKLIYMNVTFDPTPVSGADAVEEALKVLSAPVLTRRTIHGARDFREFCEGHPEFQRRLMTMMEVAHLNNLNPRTLRASLEGRLGLQSGRRTVGNFALRARNDCPSLVVMNPKGLDTGHCCMAYKVLRFEKASLVYLYDPNFVYDPARKNHRRTLLKLDHERNDLRLFPSSLQPFWGVFPPRKA